MMLVNFTKRRHILQVFLACFILFRVCVSVLLCTCVCRCTCIYVNSSGGQKAMLGSLSIIPHFSCFETEHLTEPGVLDKKPENPRDPHISVFQYCNYKKLQPSPALYEGSADGIQILMFPREHPRSSSLDDKDFADKHISSALAFNNFLSVC